MCTGPETCGLKAWPRRAGCVLLALAAVALTCAWTSPDKAVGATGTTQFSSASTALSESSTARAVSVTRSGGSQGAVEVTVATEEGGTATGGASCTAGVDFITLNTTLAWADGETGIRQATLSFCPDAAVEPDETVNLALSNPTGGATLGTPSTMVHTILDDDAAGAGTTQFSSASTALSESSTARAVSVTRSGGSQGAVEVTVATEEGGTATGGASCTAGVDFITLNTTLAWADGETGIRQATLSFCPDAAVEPDETVNLALSNPTGGATLGTPSTMVHTILDDDAAGAGTTQFSSASTALSESSTARAVSVTRSGGSQGAVEVTVATEEGGTATGGASCTAGVDFITLNTTLAWADGETGIRQATLSFCPDAAVEPDETVNLALSNPTGGATLGTPSTMVHTILDDDPPNQPPTAVAGPDQTVDSDAGVNLNGTASTDPDTGDTLDYTWTQTAGPSVSLTGADTATPSFTAPTGPASLTFQLEVCDGEPLCDTDTVLIAVNPEDPGAAPLDLSDAGQNANRPQVAIDADGDAIFTWEASTVTGGRVQARARAANGTLSAVQTLSGTGADSPQVAIDADGDAVFTWVRTDGTYDRIQARARAANGTLSAVQTLSGTGQNADTPQVAIDADGDAVFTWQRSDGSYERIQARARAANGTLSAVQTLSGAGNPAEPRPQVAIDADGDAVFTWSRADGSNVRVQARARAANGTLRPVQTLSGTGQHAYSPQVAIDADGDAVFTWQRSDGTSERIQARARSAAGTLSAVQTLSGAGQDANSPEVAIDADGYAVFSWQRSDGTSERIQARARSAAGTLSAVQTLSDAGQDANSPEVAIDADGDAAFTWQRSDGTSDRIQARARSAAGALGAVQTLSGAGQSADSPQVAIDADGDAAFTWQRSDSVNSRIQAAFGP